MWSCGRESSSLELEESSRRSAASGSLTTEEIDEEAWTEEPNNFKRLAVDEAGRVGKENSASPADSSDVDGSGDVVDDDLMLVEETLSLKNGDDAGGNDPCVKVPRRWVSDVEKCCNECVETCFPISEAAARLM